MGSKYKELFETTNRSLYNKLYKHYVCNKYGLCDRGTWHHGCNRWYKDRAHDSWKDHRKTQYKEMQPSECSSIHLDDGETLAAET